MLHSSGLVFQTLIESGMGISLWANHFEGEPSEATLRRHYDPKLYRVSKSNYSPRMQGFPGLMASGACYALQGACRHRFGQKEIILKAGEFCELPGGDFTLDVLSASPVVLVRVWDMRALFARAGIPWSPQGGAAAG